MNYYNPIYPPRPAEPFPQAGNVRLRQVLEFVNVSKSVWYEGIKAGKYPKQFKIAKRAVRWDAEEIRRCVARLRGQF